MVKAAEDGTGRPLSEIRGLLTQLGRQSDRERFAKYGPHICPESHFERKDLDFQVTQVSDCVVVSAEISPAGAINLVNHCWGAAIALLTKGVMVRGYVTRGKIYHEGNEFIGTGYQTAYEKEGGVTAFKREADEKGTPFIEVDPSVHDYIRTSTDECVRTMFSRHVRQDREVTAIFPFQVLSHSFIIGDFMGHRFDPQREKNSNNVTRNNLRLMKERVLQYVDKSNANAMKKAEHYISALDAQIVICDQTDEFIVGISRPVRAIAESVRR